MTSRCIGIRVPMTLRSSASVGMASACMTEFGCWPALGVEWSYRNSNSPPCEVDLSRSVLRTVPSVLYGVLYYCNKEDQQRIRSPNTTYVVNLSEQYILYCTALTAVLTESEATPRRGDLSRESSTRKTGIAVLVRISLRH